MNSNSTTFPRSEDNVIDPPVGPFVPTTGNVKSGAKEPLDTVETEVVVCTGDPPPPCITEYATHTKTMIMIGIPAFSHQLRPLFFDRGFFDDTKTHQSKAVDEF